MHKYLLALAGISLCAVSLLFFVDIVSPVDQPVSARLDAKPAQEVGNQRTSGAGVQRYKPTYSLGASSENPDIVSARQRIQDGDFEAALGSLRQLYENRKTYSRAEEISILELYAASLKAMEFNRDAIAAYEELLAFPELESKAKLDSLKSLGELYLLETEYQKSRSAYEQWIAESDTADAKVLKGLAFSFYYLQQYENAWKPAIEHVSMIGVENADRNTLQFLNGLTYMNENWENAAWLTRVMIERFDNPIDWRNLSAIYASMGETELQAKAIADAMAAGKIDSSGNIIEIR